MQAAKLLIHEQEYQLLSSDIQKAISSSEDNEKRKINNPKSESPIWKLLKIFGRDKFKKIIKTNEHSGKKQRFCQWDDLHNDIEVFDSNKNHLGSMDPQTGRMYKGPKNYRIS